MTAVSIANRFGAKLRLMLIRIIHFYGILPESETISAAREPDCLKSLIAVRPQN